MSLALHPDHLADLRKSMLTDTSIAAAHIHSVAPGDLEKKLGQRLFAQVDHAYSIPYFTISGKVNGFERLKLFPPTGQSLDVRYWQEPESRVHLYLPPGPDWEKIAADPTTPLAIAEGEKKGLAAVQFGLNTVAIGGCWNFRIKLDNGDRIVLPELDQFVWKDRYVEIALDSDGWRKEKLYDVLGGFFAFAMELTLHGARVVFVKLPDITGLSKAGLDDWLIREGTGWRDSWRHLERIALDDHRLDLIIKWWQTWRQKTAMEDAVRNGDAEGMELVETAGLYAVRSRKHGVKLLFDRITEQRDRLSAEVTVMVGAKEVLPTNDLNLKANRAKAELAKSLARLPFLAAIPWTL